MLYERCMLTKRDNEWIGLVELRQRIGERYRFIAILMLLIFTFESFSNPTLIRSGRFAGSLTSDGTLSKFMPT